MRLHSGTSIAPLFLASSVVARSAVLFAPHESADSFISTGLDPSEAALVLLQRAGLSQYHTLRGANQHALEAINNFGVHSPSPFSSDEQITKPNFVIVVDGVQDTENFVDRSSSRHIKIENPPSSDSTSQFIRDLYAEAPTSKPDQSCDLDKPDALLDCVGNWLNLLERNGKKQILYHTNYLQSIAKKHGAISQFYDEKSSALASQLATLIRESPYHFDLTILITPLEEPRRSIFGFSKTPKWIDQHTPLSRRQEPDLESGHPDVTPENKNLNQHIPEDPELSVENPDPASVPEDQQQEDPAPQPAYTTRPASNAQPAPVQSVGTAQSSTTPPRGILPACYNSESACEKATHNCSGHGSCKRVYTIEDHSCYSCACEAEREERKAGVKTTVWAGPACQKKDVSTPFWLLVGATIGLVGAVTWGLGLLYGMGSEELPSVLSAGVGGIPRGK